MQKMRRVTDNPLVCFTDRLDLTAAEIDVLTRLYDQEIRYVDERVGELINRLDRFGLLDDTLVVVTADHGEHLGERGLFSHAASLYQPIVHIPLIVRPPGGSQSAVVNEPVQHIDILPTLADVCELDMPEAGSLPGVTLARSATQPLPERYLFAEWEGRVPFFVRDRLRELGKDDGVLQRLRRRLWMCRSGRYKLILDDEGAAELYNLAEDSGESHNLADKEHERTAELKKAVAAYRASKRKEIAQSYDYSEGAIRDHLKALGYL